MKKLNLFAIVLSLFTVVTTASAKPAPIKAPIRINDTVQWGGEGISVQVSKDPFNARVTFDCAVGTVEKMRMDKKGGFFAKGTYTQRSGARPPHEPVAQPAHYVGLAKDGVMALMVVIDSDPSHPATFVLKKGSFGHIIHCE